MAKFFKKENGQSAVEFALVVPILLALVFGIIDFGWLFYNQLTIQDACREGARYACVNYSEAGVASGSVNTSIREKVEENLPDSVEVLSVDPQWSSETPPEKVTVKIRANIQTLTPILGTFYRDNNNKKTVTYEVVMKVES